MNILDTPSAVWEHECSDLLMPRPYSNAQFNKSGDFLSQRIEWPSLDLEWEAKVDAALDTVSAWRAMHAYPLKHIARTLEQRALSIDKEAILSQRLKRLRSIRYKLKKQTTMSLTTMNDIGGCRAVVGSTEQVYKLKKVYEKYARRFPDIGPELVHEWTKDYIQNPKPDGYRSVHLIFRYRSSRSPKTAYLDGLRIEVQIRSRMQHAWAMAVETASAVTNQGLKSGEGEDQWKRFFFLMGSIIALHEDCPLLANGTSSEVDLRDEAASLAIQLRVIPLLEGMSHVLESFNNDEEGDIYLMALDSHERKVTYQKFRESDFRDATVEYAQWEKEHADNPEVNVVLVSVRSIHELRDAYPSYFLNSSEFIELVRMTFN